MQLIKTAKRPNENSIDTIPLTQFFHEWVHFLEDNEGYNIADGSRGKPSFPKDADALKAITELYENSADVFGYGTNCLGEKIYREKAAKGFTNEYGVQFEADNIIFTQGGQFAIAATFYLIEKLYPNSCILTPKPWYLNHYDIAGMFGANGFSAIPNNNKFIGINALEHENKKVNFHQLRNAAEQAKKEGKNIGAFLFCNPSNPLGTVYRKEDWEEILEIFDIIPDIPIILDEAFAEVVFDKNYNISLLHAEPKLKDRIILMRSGTKALGFPGERLAAMAVPQKYLPIFTSFQSRLLGNPSLSLQAGMAEVMLKMNGKKKGEISDYYLNNYNFLQEKLSLLNFCNILYQPEGGFYSLYDFSALKGMKIPERAKEILGNGANEVSNDVELAIGLMVGKDSLKKGVATIPASAFGIKSEKLILRISHSSYKEELEEIADNLRVICG